MNNTGSGIHITGTGSLDAVSNTITGNSGDGITKIGTGLGSHFNSNVIHTNGELGIDLGDNNVTANDNNDTDTGPNNLQNFPVINYVRRGDGVANFTLNAANGSYRIQFYSNTVCDPLLHGEGEVLLATQTITVAGNNFTGFSAALAFGAREQITATATHDVNNNGNFDDDGNTSEFSACRKVNTLPTITPQAGNTRQQGSPVSNTQIAVVADPDQTLNTLAVTVNGGAAATVNGVTLSNIVVSAGGFVTADIVAACNATTPANFTLRVTDNATEFNEATLTVTVTPNSVPTLGTYPNTIVTLNGGGTVTPSAAPTDNGTFTLTVAASPNTLNDDLSINQTTGVVTITGAEPSGTFTVTVTSTDNFNATATSQFQVIVNAPPTITAQAGVSRQQGSPATNSQIATVNDPDQTANTLVVTVNGGATATVNGVTVSSIAVSAAGSVTANIIANTATFTLRVTDTQGAFAETAFTVTVVVGGFEGDLAPHPNGDGNGVVNSGDVTQIQRFSVGLDRPFQANEFQRADVAPLGTFANIRLGGGSPVGMFFFPNTTDVANGRLGLTINAPANQTFAAGAQQILLIDFTVAVGAPGMTTLSFDDSQAQRFVGDINGNQFPTATFPSNTISLTTATAANVSVGGRVFNAEGRAISNAQFSMIDGDGGIRSARTNSFGYYGFTNVPAGVTYRGQCQA